MVDCADVDHGVEPAFTLLPPTVKEKKKKKPAKKDKIGADQPNHHKSNPKKDRPYFVK